MADNLLLCMGKAFPPRSRECVYLLTLRQGHSLARDGDRKKGRELEREEEWRESSRGMESKGICNANGCPATLNNSKCWMEILLFWSPVINFCRSGPFSFGLFWPMHLPFCTTSSSFPLLSLSLTLSRLYFRSCPLYLCVFRKKKKKHFLPLRIHRNSTRLLPSRFPLRSSSLISHVASFLANSLKRIERRRKEAPLCFYGPNFLVQLICGLYAASSHGGYRWWTFVRALSKLFLLKERRERIISHLLNIRFIHNAAGVFIERVLLPLLIAVLVAVVELVSLVHPLFFFVSPSHPPRSKRHFFFLKSEMFDVLTHSACLCLRHGEKKLYFPVFGLVYFLPLMCCSLCPSAASAPIELRGSGLIYYLMD